MRLIAVWYKITIPPENVLSCNVVYIVILNLKFETEFEKVSESFSKCIRIHKRLYITIVQYFTASKLESLKRLRFSPQRDCQDSEAHCTTSQVAVLVRGKGNECSSDYHVQNLTSQQIIECMISFLIYAFQAPRQDQKNLLSNENYISTIQSNSGFKQVKRINKGEEFNEKVFFLFHHKLQILSHNTARNQRRKRGSDIL